ncbi:hypothetical protein GO730_20325 [Spirosoma sp. HMF3257]|uniref:WG repeat-containing protein n=1 Tax=Spirosoma telluris TaxID=2183553 RepID=A0A327NMG5_9BACT|nr:hypothetical protein [Spirosoma telluris]RAI75915.1 hypothetical protein HMF3257_20250 [Spirosoma telluris]
MRYLFVYWLLFWSYNISFGQNDKKYINNKCPYFNKLIQEIKSLSSNNNRKYALALNKLYALREYCPDGSLIIEKEIQDIISKMKKQKIDLEKQVKQNNKLISRFSFSHNRAWAYRNGKFAVINRIGDTLTSFQFDNPQSFSVNGTALAQKADKNYLIFNDGRVSEPFIYILPTNNSWYIIRGKNGVTFLDRKLNKVSNWDYYDKIFQSYPFFKVLKNDKWAIADKNGNLSTKLSFLELDEIYDKKSKEVKNNYIWCARALNGLWGLVNLKDTLILKAEYDEITTFKHGYANIKKNNKWGLVDSTGRIIVSPQSEKKVAFNSNGYFWIYKEKKWELINKNNKLILQRQFDLIDQSQEFTGGYIWVGIENKLAWIDSTGQLIDKQKFDLPDGDATGGYINNQGHKFNNGYAWIRKDGRWKLVNSKGDFAFDSTYINVQNFIEGYAWVEKTNKWGLINMKGEYIIKPQYDSAKRLGNGLNQVSINGQSKIIDNRNKIINLPERQPDTNLKSIFVLPFKKKVDFLDDLARINEYGEHFIINTKGEVIVDWELHNKQMTEKKSKIK